MIYSAIGGHGALYAIRRDLYEDLPGDAINDDYIIPARAALKGYRVVYETKAHIYDYITTDWRTELRRRIRIAYGNWQQIFILRGLLNPKRIFISLQFFSHKVLRALDWLLFICLIATAPFVFPKASGVLQAALLTGTILLAAGLFLRKPLRSGILRGILFLAIVFYAQIAGMFKFIFRRKIDW